MLTARELNDLRSDVYETLPDTGVVLRETTTNSNGYSSASWGTVETAAHCRLDPVRQQGRETIADREAGITYWQLTLAYDADIADGDRIVIDGLTYETKQVYGAHSDHIVKRALLAKVG